MEGGYHGRLLRLDLTSGEWRVERSVETFARQFLGGNGFAADILLHSFRLNTGNG